MTTNRGTRLEKKIDVGEDWNMGVESRGRISWMLMMVGGRQGENDSDEMLRRATRRIKGEYMDRIGRLMG
jgi:hypothetical protein